MAWPHDIPDFDHWKADLETYLEQLRKFKLINAYIYEVDEVGFEGVIMHRIEFSVNKD